MLHCFVFTFTFSTSGFLAFGLLLPTLALLLHQLGTLRLGRIVLVMICVALVVILGVAYTLQVSDIQGLFYTRTIASFEKKRLEHYVLSYLQTNPQHLLLGMGPGNYNFYVSKPGYDITSATWGLQVLSSGILTLIVDVGIIGLGAVFAATLGVMRQSIRLHRWLKGNSLLRENILLREILLVASAAVTAAVCLMPFLFFAFRFLMLFLGILVACNRMVYIFSTHQASPIRPPSVFRFRNDRSVMQ